MSNHDRHFFFGQDQDDNRSQTMHIPIEEITKLRIGKHDDIEESSSSTRQLFLTIVAHDCKFHFLQKDSAFIHGLMNKLSNQLSEINQQMNMQEEEMLDALFNIQNGHCRYVTIEIIPLQSVATDDENMVAIESKKNHFFAYLNDGKLSKQAAPLIVKNGYVEYTNSEISIDIPLEEISKIIIGKHDQMPKSALSENCHMLLTIMIKDGDESYCFLKKCKSEFSIEQFLINLCNESAKMKDMNEVFTLNEEQMHVFEMMKAYDGKERDSEVHMTILPEEREENKEEYLMDEDGKIGFWNEQTRRVSMTIYATFKQELNESESSQSSESTDTQSSEEERSDWMNDGTPVLRRTKSIEELEEEIEELESFEKDELNIIGLEEEIPDSVVCLKDVVSIKIDEEDHWKNVDLELTMDYVKIGKIKMNYSKILVLIYCMDFKKKWAILNSYGNTMDIIASSEKAREKCISFMQSGQPHVSIRVSLY